MTTIEKRRTKYEGRRRLSLDISEELYERLQRNFEWGERTRVTVGLLEYACSMVEANGSESLAIFLRPGNFEDLSEKILKEVTNVNN